MSGTFWVFLLFFTEMLLFGVAWIAFRGDFMSPSVFTLIMFTISTGCYAYSTGEWIVEFGFKAYSLFALTFILMILTEYTVMRMSRKKFLIWHNTKITNISMLPKNSIYIKKPYDRILVIIFACFSFTYIYRVYRSGMSLGAASFLMTIGKNLQEGDFDFTSRLFYNLIRMLGYVYAVIFSHNVFTCNEPVKKNWTSLSIMIFTIIDGFFSGQRAAFIAYIVGVTVAMFIAIYMKHGKTKNIEVKKFFKKLVIVAICILAAFYASSNIVKATNIERPFLRYMLYYFGSTTYLMGIIVYHPYLCHAPFTGYFGEKTFMGFYTSLYSWGILDNPPAEVRWISMGQIAGNEFTFLCGPYIDFGFVGALLFVIIFYAVFAFFYYKFIRNNVNIKKRIIITSIYIFFYAMVAQTFYYDLVRSYTRPINILYILYIITFCKLFIRIKKNDLEIYPNAITKQIGQEI